MKKTPRYIFVLMAIILVTGGFLRFNGLAGQGIIFYDTGNMALEAQLLHNSIFNPGRCDELLNGGISLWTRRPAYSILLAAAYVAGGVNDATVLYVNAVLGLITVLGIFYLFFVLGESHLGIYAASCLAILQWHIFYSRTGLAEAAPALCIVLAYVFYFRKQDKWFHQVISGLWMGLAYTFNYRILLMPVALILMPVIPWIKQRNGSMKVKKQILFLCIGMIIPLLFQEALSQSYFIPRGLQHESYLRETIKSLIDPPKVERPEFAKQHFTYRNSGFYIRYFYTMEGVLMSLLWVMGITYLAFRNRPMLFVGALPILLPVLIFSFYAVSPLATSLNNRFPRALSPCLPFIAVFAGAGLYAVERILLTPVMMKPRTFGAVILCFVSVVMALFGIVKSGDLKNMHAGYRQVDRYVREHSNGKYFSTNAPIAWFNDGVGRVNFPPLYYDELKSVSQKEDIEYLAVDYLLERLPYQSVTELEKRCEPAVQIDNPAGAYLPVLLEVYLNFEYAEKIMDEPYASKILVFYLPECENE